MIERRREIIDDRVEHELHALVLERAAGKYREDLVGDDALAQGLL